MGCLIGKGRGGPWKNWNGDGIMECLIQKGGGKRVCEKKRPSSCDSTAVARQAGSKK